MARTYLAAVMPAPNEPIELREFPEPEFQPSSALLHTMYLEVCGTDVHLLHGKLAGAPYPIIPGHVSVGAVAQIRGSITYVDGNRIKEGGCWGSRYEHFHRAVQIAARFGANKPWREMVTATYPLEDANTAARAVESRTASKALIDPAVERTTSNSVETSKGDNNDQRV
jgi:threonine dehydrogenase-like Zn-dependent dehydrogenase